MRAAVNRLERERGAGAAARALVDEAVRRTAAATVAEYLAEVFGEAALPVPAMIGTNEVARRLGMAPSNIGKGVSRGLVPALELERGKLFRVSDVDRIVASMGSEGLAERLAERHERERPLYERLGNEGSGGDG